MSTVEKQQALLQGVVLADSAVPETTPEFNDREVSYKLVTGSGCKEKDGKLIITKENAQAKLVFDGLDECETYLITEGVDYEALSPRELISDKKWNKMTLYEQKKFNTKTVSGDTGKKVRRHILMLQDNSLTRRSVFLQTNIMHTVVDQISSAIPVTVKRGKNPLRSLLKIQVYTHIKI